MRWTPLILLFCLAGAVQAAPAERVPAYTATYEASVLGNTLIAQSTLSHEGENIRMAMDAHLSGFLRLLGRFEFDREAVFRSNGADLQLLETRSSQVTPRRERRVETRFEWTANRALGHINQQPFELEIPPDTLDFLSSLYLTMQELREGNLGDALSVKVLERDRLREYTIETRGRQQIDTALGRMEAYHVVRRQDGSDVELAGWFVPELHYLPVRLDYEADGNQLELVLTGVEWH